MKSWDLFDRMLHEANNDVLVMSDSDIRVKPDMLRALKLLVTFQGANGNLTRIDL